jgi:hypothetical protein
MASKDFFWEDDSAANFGITIQLPGGDPRLRPGFSAQLLVLGDVRKNVFYVPRQALFIKDGKRVAYVKNGSGFERREVKVLAETESRAAIEGLQLDTEVALLDPFVTRKTASQEAAEPSLGGGR